MILSMTGFGSHSITENNINVKCEILSLNKKNIEIQLNLPRYVMFMDTDIRKIANDSLIRGKITINFDITIQNENKVAVADKCLLKSFINELKSLEKEFNIENDMTASKWMNVSPIWSIQDKFADIKTLKPIILDTLNHAIQKLIKMRKNEGICINKDIIKRLEYLSSKLTLIEKRSPITKKIYEDKIKKSVKNSKDVSTTENDIFNRFISLFNEKADISEEITRLKSHIEQFKTFLKSNKEVGRSLDFLLQEFLRETNTIGSKASDIIISKNVVEMKSTIEQIREQIQNIL